MAISVYTSTDEKFAFAEQTTWGTAVGDSAAKIGILTEGFGVDNTINFRAPSRAKAQRYNMAADMIADTKGVVYQTNGLNTPALKDQLDYFLYGVMQNVTESSGTPYQKTFTFAQTQPDFSVNGGEFFTLFGQQQVASVSQKMYDAIISELTLTCAPGTEDGAMMAAPVFMARGHSDTANPSGTITYPDQASTDFFYFHDIKTAHYNASDLILGENGITITIRNGAVRLGQDTGMPQTFALPRYEVEIQVHALWDAGTRAAIAAAEAGTSNTFEFEWGTAGSDGHLEFTGTAKLQNAVNLEHALEGNFVTLNMVCAGTYGSTEPFQVVLSNATDRSW